MPCLVVTGYPCAGKTTLSRQLQQRALLHPSIENVVILNEESTCPDNDKNKCYDSSLSEKKTRAALKSAFDRAVGGGTSNKTLIILDSLNYIKGFRYELHCISKAAGERHGILWVLNHTDIAASWNANRPALEQYRPDLLQELIQRYESPDERNRWDKPLYTVNVAPLNQQSSKSESVQQSVYNMHSLGDALGSTQPDETNQAKVTAVVKQAPKKSAFSRAKKKNGPVAEPTVPETQQASTAQDIVENQSSPREKSLPSIEQELDSLLDKFLLHSAPLKMGTSTKQHIAGNADALQSLHSITQRLVSVIVSAQTTHTGGKLQLPLSEHVSLSMECPRTVALPELRRLRTQYLQWTAGHPPEDISEKGVAVSFVTYLEDQL